MYLTFFAVALLVYFH